MGSIHAGDVNITDSPAGDISLCLDGQEHFDGPVAADNASIKNQAEFTFQTNVSYGHCNVTLKDSNTKSPLPDKNVSFTINNINYPAKTDNEGIAGVNVNLTPGTYTVNVNFAGDSTYESVGISSAVEMLATVSAGNQSKYYKGSTKYAAAFLDSHGNPLNATPVSITVNGKTYSRKTDAGGIARLAVNLKPGTYKATSLNPATGYALTTTFRILPTISSSNLKKVEGDNRKFTAKFLKSNGKALANKIVKIKVNGKLQKAKTDSKGKVKLSLNSLKKGKYTVICYNKDGLSKSQKVRIYNKAKTELGINTSSFHTFLPNDTKIIKITLSTRLGGDSAAGKDIRITLGGITYVRKTDSKGVVNFNLPANKGFFTVKYEYGGDRYFKPSQVSNQITALDTTDTKLSVKGTTRFGHGANTPIKVAFTAGGVTLAKKKVTLAINGKTYTETTNAKGIVSVPVTLEIGNYTISYSAPGDSYVRGTSGQCNITVFKRAPSKLSWQSAKSYKDSSQSFKVLLTDSNGKAISGETIELAIDGETYKSKTSSKGYATFRTAVALGNYNVQFTFEGNNEYLPTSASKSITVKLSKFGNGLNQRHASASGAFLQSTSYCPVNNAKIKSLVSSLTSGLTNNIDKAKALFNYVRDNVGYSYYYNSHKGAVATLNSKTGNCADQAHLLVAMYRAAGFKARYVHGVCTFSDGRFGHVWTQVLIDNTWVCGDPISYKNALGKINNWNTHTYNINGKYLSLPF